MLLNNRYRVIRTLGSGGFGETFLAEDTQMPSLRCCVIKQLKPIHHNSQVYQLVQERFQREAAILEKLGGSSDQIPTLYAYFQLNGQFYLVQEWIEGDTLTAKVEQGVLSESSVQEILINLLPVLEGVHSQHIVHRDIKPDNIIIRNRDGKPVLIDFGAVRETMGTAISSQGSLTSSIVIGTPGYMPSEQAAGRPVYSSDLYSLGVTAIYLLTGRHPQQLATDSYTGEIIWREYAPHVSPTMAAILERAIAYHPRERFPTARDMLNTLQSADNSLPTLQPSFIQRLTPTAKVSSPEILPTLGQSTNHKGILVGSVIVGSLIGGSVIIGLLLTKSPSSVQQASYPNATPILAYPTQTVSQSIVKTPTPQVNYAWLSSRRVTDVDLVGKDGFTLDIMRNEIFARHGRRFQTPGLQNYFDSQPWYRATYSPDEFDKLNLLSPLEQQNVADIAAYQSQYNLRYFNK